MDTPGAHHDLLENIGAELTILRGPVKEDVLLPIIADFDGVLCGDDEYTRKVIETGKNGNLKAISKYGIGLDKIDQEAAKEFGIPVGRTPGVNHTTVAESALTHMLTFYKHYFDEVGFVKKGEWKRLVGNEICGKTLAIFGMGRIGKEVAIRAKAFGLKVKVFDTYMDYDFARWNNLEVCDSLENLVKDADIITLHAPLLQETANAFNEKLFGLLENCPLIVNTARAGLVDKTALKKALDNSQILGYSADVWWDEPINPKEELLAYPNVFVTPHISSRTYESVVRQGCAAVQNLINMLNLK